MGKCHKFVLFTNSEVFDAMFAEEFEETKGNKVKMDNFREETVISFLEYLYSKSVPKRTFDRAKLTPELLRMAHMYRVDDLELKCTERLRATLCDENVMDIWMEAERCKNEALCSTAIKHLCERPRGKTLHEVSGFNEAFQGHDKPLKDLIKKLTENNSHLKEEIVQLREKYMQDVTPIKITVTRPPPHYEPPWTDIFYVKQHDKISSLLDKVLIKLGPPYRATIHPHPPIEYALTKSTSNLDRIGKDSTFSDNGICTGKDYTLYLWEPASTHAW